MNPYIFDPRKMTGVPAAKYVIGLFQKEIALNVAQKIPLEEALAATSDAVVKANPEMSDNLQLVASQAAAVGHCEGNRQNLDANLSQFIAALPYGIRQQVQAGS